MSTAFVTCLTYVHVCDAAGVWCTIVPTAKVWLSKDDQDVTYGSGSPQAAANHPADHCCHHTVTCRLAVKKSVWEHGRGRKRRGPPVHLVPHVLPAALTHIPACRLEVTLHLAPLRARK